MEKDEEGKTEWEGNEGKKVNERESVGNGREWRKRKCE